MIEEALYAGLISGTSMDGVDAAVCSFDPKGLRVLCHATTPWPDADRVRLQRLAQPGADGLDLLGEADRRAGEFFAQCLLGLLDRNAIPKEQVIAVGSHGQTVRHRPQGACAFTLQIGDPNRIAERTGITTVADFRRRDMAAGGQGAPLVCGLHQALFQSEHESRAVLNIGGIANLTLLPADPEHPISGFDTGPGNTLSDHWCRRHLAADFDQAGRWAASGAAEPGLLARMLADPYFTAAPPKTTGPEYFSPAWLDRMLGAHAPDCAPEAVQSTLLQLTAESVRAQLQARQRDCERLLVCGGGVHNQELMRRLAAALPQVTLESTASHGLDPDAVEAAAFAWMARQTMRGAAGNVSSVTGAERNLVLGGIYPGRAWPAIG